MNEIDGRVARSSGENSWTLEIQLIKMAAFKSVRAFPEFPSLLERGGISQDFRGSET
jgi:hypothetical protein